MLPVQMVGWFERRWEKTYGLSVFFLRFPFLKKLSSPNSWKAQILGITWTHESWARKDHCRGYSSFYQCWPVADGNPFFAVAKDRFLPSPFARVLMVVFASPTYLGDVWQQNLVYKWVVRRSFHLILLGDFTPTFTYKNPFTYKVSVGGRVKSFTFSGQQKSCQVTCPLCRAPIGSLKRCRRICLSRGAKRPQGGLVGAFWKGSWCESWYPTFYTWRY